MKKYFIGLVGGVIGALIGFGIEKIIQIKDSKK